ncbi:TolC family protein [Flavobacteriaceae bacterium Ap0902]|nr:TolC family protein [Flavobacteriaceae bacterium Ap0902]
MKNLKLYTLFILLGLLPQLQAQELSFTEAVQWMQTHNEKLLGTHKQAEAAQLGAESAKGLRWPTLSLEGNYIWMNDDLYLNFNKYKYAVSGITGLDPALLGDWKVKFQDYNVGRLSADFSWPIFTGGKIKAGVKAGQLQADFAKLEIEKVESNLIKDLANRYFQTQLAKEAILVREQALASAEKHLYNAQKLEENGMLAPVETMQAQTAVADANRELKAAQKDEELARAALFGLMGIPEDSVQLSTPLFEVKKLESLAYYQDLAKQNFPEIVQARIKKQLAEQKVAAEKANFIPDIALVAKQYLLSDNLPITEPDGYVGIGMKVNIFNGFQNKRNYEQAVTVSESVDLLTAQAERDIQTLVKKHYTEILKQQEQLTSLEESIAFAEELVRVREKAFAAGFATSTDVADANLYLASIKIKRLQALYEIDKTLAELLETSGVSAYYLDFIL